MDLTDFKISQTKVFSGHNKAGELACDMKEDCTDPVSMIDNKGFAYCEKHGTPRKHSVPCRKLKPKELEQLKSGNPVEEY